MSFFFFFFFSPLINKCSISFFFLAITKQSQSPFYLSLGTNQSRASFRIGWPTSVENEAATDQSQSAISHLQGRQLGDFLWGEDRVVAVPEEVVVEAEVQQVVLETF